jgi:hypothetical protein
MSASWRSEGRRKSDHPTNMLFHVSDAHGVTGVLPDFAGGETWDTIHDRLHVERKFKGQDHVHGEEQ